jgi:glycosyltransferase involved in cell wall biosynthesis
MHSSLQAGACGEGATRSASSVAVLLCTYNGGRYLTEQLESIADQQGAQVHIYVSDDGSTDQTLHLLDRFLARGGKLSIRKGPGRGYVANFLSLICSPIEADYFAYADQDDVWDPDKLSRALAALSSVPDEMPAVYCSRTRLVNDMGKFIGLSPLFRRPPVFANSLIHNVGGGNTMVLNRSARDLLRAAGLVDVASHDWWTYILVAGSGGAIIYDPHPSMCYRQHDGNLIGSNMSWRDRLNRFYLALRGRNRRWNTKNIAALQQNREIMTTDSQQVLDEFCKARDAGLFPRMLGILRSGVHTQSLGGNLALVVATFLKKL